MINRFHIREREFCSVCGHSMGDPLIVYPNLPLTGIYARKYDPAFVKGIDQHFHVCTKCGHAQLSQCIGPDFLYGLNYKFRTSASKLSMAGIDCFLKFLNSLIGRKRFDRVVDIGCNDLYLLKKLTDRAELLAGIDPVWRDRKSHISNQIKLVGDVLENVDVHSVMGGAPDLVLSTHTLEHIYDPKAFIKKLFDASSTETLFVFEFPGFAHLVECGRFDQIFHQHLQYFTFSSFKSMMNALGGEIVAHEESYSSWGPLRVAFRKSLKPANNAAVKSAEIHKYIVYIRKRFNNFRLQMRVVKDILESQKRPIYGYGAALMLPALLYHLDIDENTIDTIIDDDPAKEGMTYINLPVSIKAAKAVSNISTSTILVTAMDNARPILRKLGKLGPMGPKNVVLPLNII